ncbi:angiopoietin-4-like [Saccostrea cucullata]|uniref:angiopoietin-4-like n=1 Tax=Saccostrea cuccullata TaxID=36930 RepID=UPI002ED476AE
MDCSEIYKSGQRKTGVYQIYPFGETNKAVNVMCDMDSLGGGWTVIQNRHREKPKVNFNTTWNKYKSGFGDIQGNYWLGNEAIHKLTTKFQTDLYIRITNTRNQSFELRYTSFSISDEADGYRLSLGNKSGRISDAIKDYNVLGQPFSTFDMDNNHRCGALCGAGWWFNYCTWSNLNAPFFEDHSDPVWHPVISHGRFLYHSQMLIRRY